MLTCCKHHRHRHRHLASALGTNAPSSEHSGRLVGRGRLMLHFARQAQRFMNCTKPHIHTHTCNTIARSLAIRLIREIKKFDIRVDRHRRCQFTDCASKNTHTHTSRSPVLFLGRSGHRSLRFQWTWGAETDNIPGVERERGPVRCGWVLLRS